MFRENQQLLGLIALILLQRNNQVTQFPPIVKQMVWVCQSKMHMLVGLPYMEMVFQPIPVQLHGSVFKYTYSSLSTLYTGQVMALLTYNFLSRIHFDWQPAILLYCSGGWGIWIYISMDRTIHMRIHDEVSRFHISLDRKACGSIYEEVDTFLYLWTDRPIGGDKSVIVFAALTSHRYFLFYCC